MSNKKVNCVKISVNCVANDPVDIRCGGPNYLGFDFFVEEKRQTICKSSFHRH